MKALRFCGQGTSCRGHRGLFVVALITSLIFCFLWSAARGDSLCEGCLNGGKLLMPNNIFGYCRCKCFGDYKGPKCQFLHKRSSPTKYLSAAIKEAIASGRKEDNWTLLPDAEKAIKTANWIFPDESNATKERLGVPERVESEERNHALQLRVLLDKLSDIAQNANAQDSVSY